MDLQGDCRVTASRFTDGPVVVGVDGSATARAAARWAARDAVLHRSELELIASANLSADDPYVLEPLRARYERALAESRRVAEDSSRSTDPLKITTQVVDSPPVIALLEASDRARLLVVGNRGHMAGHRVSLGTVTTALAEHCRCPLAVVRDSMSHWSQAGVVVGTDGSPGGRAAVDAAFAAADLRGVPVTVVHAWCDTDVADTSVPCTMSEWPSHRSRADAWLDAELDEVRRRYPQVTVRCAVTRDRPGRALLDHAQAAQLLVVGARGRGGFAAMRLGSTSLTVLRSARGPVMVVPHDR
ncbi:universal stress protein [Gordonia rubripertincta]|uniref:Universal stress protein n=1 Tax=Gordonia rubripertincta TaxID=36822 RepID=A0AAW4G2E3_GORRU|nr:universal stress protein [Gordonia rubripertincta]QMU23397.1 universal stress protein [Gordonia rubripertincta]